MKRELLSKSKQWLYLASVVAIILGLMMIASIASARNSSVNPGIMPPNSSAYGKTYGEWNAEWWKWSYSLLVDEHPLFDSGDCDCSKGQSGPVWFLGGSLTSEDDPNGGSIAMITRNCTIPPGKRLFFPILNVVGSTLEGNGETEEELRSYVEFIMPHAKDLYAEIDGVPVQDLEQYLAISPPFTFGPLPANSYLEWRGVPGAVEGATSLSVAGGYSLMLAPLSVGTHTIYFHGKFEFSMEAGDPFDFLFTLDVTYNITVEPLKSRRLQSRHRK